MIVDVLLESQRLIVSEATAPEELQSLTYINIVRVLPIIREQRNFSVDGAPILYEQWYARLIDATNTQLDIPLGNLTSQPGWTNDQAGYDQAEIDIYAAFPAGGGGGGTGTVTSINVSGGTTGLIFTGGPVTTSGTITASGTLDLDNGGTGATTAPLARANLHAADFYPTWTFSTNTTTNADPGAGNFRFNNATMASVTEVAISNTAHFEGGNQDLGYLQYGWAGLLFLKNIANDDIIIISLITQLNNAPYLRMSSGLNTIIVGGVSGATPANGSVWRFVSVGDYLINAQVNTQLLLKQPHLRTITSLNDTDSINLDDPTDTYYQTGGSGIVTEAASASAGRTITLKTDVAANKITFIAGGNIDGNATLQVNAGAYATIQSLGGGAWIQIG